MKDFWLGFVIGGPIFVVSMFALALLLTLI